MLQRLAQWSRAGSKIQGDPARILLVETNDDETVGGSHKALFDLVTHLDRSQYKPIVLFYRRNPFVDRLRNEGIEAHDFEDERVRERQAFASKGRVGRVVQALKAIRSRVRLIRRFDASLVHVFSSPRITADDWLPACKILGIPSVASEMLMESLCTPGAVRRCLIRRFDHILPVSGHQEGILVGLGVPPERITRIYHGIDAAGLGASVSRTVAKVRHELGVGPDEVLIAMLANVRRWKGQHILLEALALLPSDTACRTRTVFAGSRSGQDSGYAQELQELSESSKLSGRVSFLGFRTDAPDLMQAADIVVHASIEPEPGGLVVLEALAMGRPVIASQLGGQAEVIEPGAGLLFDPQRPQELADHLKALILDRAAREALGRAAAHRMESFSLRRHVEKTEAVYNELLRRGSDLGR